MTHRVARIKHDGAGDSKRPDGKRWDCKTLFEFLTVLYPRTDNFWWYRVTVLEPLHALSLPAPHSSQPFISRKIDYQTLVVDLVDYVVSHLLPIPTR